MKRIINLNKKVYSKNQYERVIDTKFSQLADSTPSSTPDSTIPGSSIFNSDITINEFFQYYDELFLQIPKRGETNSHEYLIKTSSEYINFTSINNELQALIEEINILQQTNLELNQQLAELQPTGSQQ